MARSINSFQILCKMAHYSNEEKLEMLQHYFRSNRNASLAAGTYHNSFPERQQPKSTYFRKLTMNLLEFGSFEKPRSENYAKENRRRDAAIEQHFNENPSSSTRAAGRELHLPKSTVHRVLKQHKYHPYKPTIVQGLQGNDHLRRIEFCNWYINQCNADPAFPNHVVWSDETRFSNCGVFNHHNYHFGSTENPELRAQRRLQVRFGFNVWCGIIGIIGPFIYDKTLNGVRYLVMLRNQIVPAIRESIPEEQVDVVYIIPEKFRNFCTIHLEGG